MSISDFPDSDQTIVKDRHYGLQFKIMEREDYDEYVDLFRSQNNSSGIEPYGRGEVLLLYYYNVLIGSAIIIPENNVGMIHHLLIDKDYRGRGFGTILLAVTTFHAQQRYARVGTMYRDRELYAKLYSEAGYRPLQLVKWEEEK